MDYILKTCRSLETIKALLQDTDISAFETDADRLANRHGPIHFLIDGLDEFGYVQARSWLEVQLGLFNLAFLQDVTRNIAKSVHLSIALRNYVFVRALRSPHRDRFRRTVTSLNWDASSARAFLGQRLKGISTLNFAGASRLNSEAPLETWLGFDEVSPKKRGSSENVVDYLLRHTRFSPRELVSTFNELANKQCELCLEDRQITKSEFREIVRKQARTFGLDMLSTAAEEVMALVWTPKGASQHYDATSPEHEYVIDIVTELLVSSIKLIDSEVCSREDLLASLKVYLSDHFAEAKVLKRVALSIEAVLWRSGIIAYREQKDGESFWRFPWAEGKLGFANPHNPTTIVGFHGSMIDVCDIKVHADGPVC